MNATDFDISVLGIPVDHNASFLRGAAGAPPLIREAFFSDASNLWTENGMDLGLVSSDIMAGDLGSAETPPDFETIEQTARDLLQRGRRIISLGGDHSITWPLIRACSEAWPGLNILHLDAHPDLYDDLQGNRHSHASPFARIMEQALAGRLVQVGIRTLNGHQREQARRFGVEIIEMRHIRKLDTLEFDGPLYLSLDIDCLDPAFAPGVSHHEPGGMTTREVLSLIQNVRGWLVGADIVEYNPVRDVNGVTAMTAAKCLKEILGRMLTD